MSTEQEVTQATGANLQRATTPQSEANAKKHAEASLALKQRRKKAHRRKLNGSNANG